MMRLAPLYLVGLVLWATGCGPPPPLQFDTTRLRTMRTAIAKAPDPPPPPLLRQHTKESVVNHVFAFRGEEAAVSQQQTIAVLGDGVPRHVTDAMILELKLAGARVVDREYSDLA